MFSGKTRRNEDSRRPSTAYGLDEYGLWVVATSSMKISDDPRTLLVTLVQSSCLAVTVYDPALRMGGMINCMLPTAKTGPEKAAMTPCAFVDTGVSRLLQDMFDRGLNRSRAQIKMIGAARSLGAPDQLHIGQRNATALRKLLWQNDLVVKACDVGGNGPRSVCLDVATGQVLVRKDGVARALKGLTLDHDHTTVMPGALRGGSVG